MADYTELEIGIRRQDADSYAVELRFNDPDSETSEPPELGLAHFDFLELQRQGLWPEAYGKQLSKSLFLDPRLLEAFKAACKASLGSDRKLLLRLFIDRSAPELHSLRWETLRDPRPGHEDSWLLTDERILFSRYLRIAETRPVRFRPKGDIRALVVIANPNNLDAYTPGNQRLAPIDTEGELARTETVLGECIKGKLYSDPTNPGRVTLNHLVEQLREGFDILYLVCHGALLDQQGARVPFLWLENQDGTAAVESGLNLVDRLSKLPAQ